MWNKVKKILIAVGTVVIGAASFALGRLFSADRNRTEQTDRNIDEAERANSRAEAELGNAKHEVKQSAELSDDIEQCTEECLGILENVKKRGKKETD